MPDISPTLVRTHPPRRPDGLRVATTTRCRPDVYAALLEWGNKARIGRTKSRILYTERFPIPKEA